MWWLLPAVTTVLAVTWAAWVRRPPRRRSDAETVEGYARFRAALATADPTSRPEPQVSTSPGTGRQGPRAGNAPATPTV